MTVRHRTTILTLTAALLGGVVTAAPAAAATEPRCGLTWAGGTTGSWTEATNWQPARVPRTTDFVCLPADRSVVVDLGATTTVRSLATKASTLVVGDGVTLTTAYLGVTGSGGLVGPGSVAVNGTGSGRLKGTDLGGPDGPRLDGGIHVDARRYVFRVDQRLWLGGGSVVTAASTYVSDADLVVSGDRAAGTLLDTDRLVCVSADTVRIDVPVRLGEVELSGCDLTAPRLVGARANGTVDLSGFDVSRSTVAVPYPVTVLTGAARAWFDHSDVVVAATGAPALAGLARMRLPMLLDGTLHTDVPVTLDITAPGSLQLEQGARLEAPAVTVAPGTVLDLSEGSVVQLSADATGDLTLGASTSPRSLLQGCGCTVAGDLVQRNGEVAPFSRTHIGGSWTSTTSALTDFTAFVAASTPTVVTVDGAADLRGTLVLAKPDTTPPAGYRLILVRAVGGLTTHFGEVTLPRHWKLSTTPTTLVATYTG